MHHFDENMYKYRENMKVETKCAIKIDIHIWILAPKTILNVRVIRVMLVAFLDIVFLNNIDGNFFKCFISDLLAWDNTASSKISWWQKSTHGPLRINKPRDSQTFRKSCITRGGESSSRDSCNAVSNLSYESLSLLDYWFFLLIAVFFALFSRLICNFSTIPRFVW